jgi:DNA-binding NarL/FixJ family response regulator
MSQPEPLEAHLQRLAGELHHLAHRLEGQAAAAHPTLPPAALRRAWGRLPPRPRQALGYALRGHSTAEIARRMVVTPGCVRAYLARACRGLGLPNLEAARQHLSGWLGPD